MSHNLELFERSPLTGREPLAEGAVILRGFAAEAAPRLMAKVRAIEQQAPLRHMQVPGGSRMSVAMTSCGDAGWVSDRRGYRYAGCDPESGCPWPAMPAVLCELAMSAALAGGFPGFAPDSCLINSYAPGARLSLHQDSNERDLDSPIVSVSLGLPAVFLFGGAKRAERPRRVLLESGDVAVWGGPARLTFHGVAPLAPGEHPLTGARRINLTFRRAL
jgi:alkylated DNA repair protein (DNA oxidative demethylase)